MFIIAHLVSIYYYILCLLPHSGAAADHSNGIEGATSPLFCFVSFRGTTRWDRQVICFSMCFCFFLLTLFLSPILFSKWRSTCQVPVEWRIVAPDGLPETRTLRQQLWQPRAQSCFVLFCGTNRWDRYAICFLCICDFSYSSCFYHPSPFPRKQSFFALGPICPLHIWLPAGTQLSLVRHWEGKRANPRFFLPSPLVTGPSHYFVPPCSWLSLHSEYCTKPTWFKLGCGHFINCFGCYFCCPTNQSWQIGAQFCMWSVTDFIWHTVWVDQ